MSTINIDEAPRKRYGGVPDLTDVSLTIVPGTVHALVGENGAGKSTLGKIPFGVIAPDEGTLSLGGVPLSELAIVPGLTVAENVYLGAEVTKNGFVRRRETRRQFRELAKKRSYHH
jgi:ABC-type sugar transport system ATPase subunit